MNEKDKKIQLLEGKVAKLEKVLMQLQSQLKYTQGRAIRTDESLRRTHLGIDRLKRELNRRV